MPIKEPLEVPPLRMCVIGARGSGKTTQVSTLNRIREEYQFSLCLTVFFRVLLRSGQDD